MSRSDAIKVEGRVIEALPGSVFRVELPNGHRILAFCSGQIRLQFIRFSPGDKVTLEMSPFDLSKGCIVQRENA